MTFPSRRSTEDADGITPCVILAKAGIQRVMLHMQKRAEVLEAAEPTSLDPRVRGDDDFLSERLWVSDRGYRAPLSPIRTGSASPRIFAEHRLDGGARLGDLCLVLAAHDDLIAELAVLITTDRSR